MQIVEAMQENTSKISEPDADCVLTVPVMKKYFEKKRKNESLSWIPMQCSLLFSDELLHLCTATKYIYVAIMLTCGIRGSNELPFNISYLARMTGVDRRTMTKGINDLLCAKMLIQTEREKERKETESTAQTAHGAETEKAAAVCVDLKSFKNRAAEKCQNEPESVVSTEINHGHLSQFTLAECLSYVHLCIAKGDAIKNPHGLAVSLFQTGKSDAFIRALMFPDEQKKSDLETYGAPRPFTAEPCRVCFGAKMADADGQGYRKCEHCRNERGTATGFEPFA